MYPLLQVRVLPTEKTMANKKQSHDILARIAEYKHVPSLTHSQRIAHFLDWGAQHLEKTYFPYHIICKAVNGYAHTPREGSDAVELIRKAMQSVKKILRETYKRGFDYSRGLGVRATVDDNDTVNYSLATAAKRLVSSKRNVDKVASIVDPGKLSSKESVYFSNVTGASKLITTGHIQRLLPPKPVPAEPSKKTARGQ